MANRLSAETSPYLLQHAHNPVDWYPWGGEALARAREEDKPILLSIGYAACHWCHVMAHESFENEETARVMNDLFVNVKVDREERPDLDGIYMQAVQAMTGHGGWPMTVFITPNGEPFYGGTYFPPEDRHGIPSFKRILVSVADAWKSRRSAVEEACERLSEIYERAAAPAQSAGHVTAQTLERAYRTLAAQYDVPHGGFGGAPKFPPTMALDFLLKYWKRTGTSYAREMALDTFRRMARGGIYDQVGGGFARYAVDAVWLVPHFEKMLYDNALLVRFGVHLWQSTGDAEVHRVTMETLLWLEREMTSPEGGFYSSLDADSEGHEGKFYLWDYDELEKVAGADFGTIRTAWGVTREGNFEGRNLLHRPLETAMVARRIGIADDVVDATLERVKRALYDVRANRVWPGRDDKIVSSWNGLMLRGVAEAARVFGGDALRALAIRNAEFLATHVVRDGRVLRLRPGGPKEVPGFLEDHAAVALGLLDVYQLTFDARWLREARRIAAAMNDAFWDDGSASFFDTASDAEKLITRPRDFTDNATPSGTSLAAELLLRLGDLLHDAELTRRASWVLETLAEPLARHPLGFGQLLGAADMAVHGAVEVALVGPDVGLLAAETARHYVPSLVLAGGDPDGVPLLEGRETIDGQPTAYVCRMHACDRPTTSETELAQQLEAASSPANA